jgi:hypothetical protein
VLKVSNIIPYSRYTHYIYNIDETLVGMSSSQTTLSDLSNKRRKKERRQADTIKKTKSTSEAPVYQAENLISREIPKNRRSEIDKYLRLFGYKPDRTILQVHLAGFFKKKNSSQKEIDRYRAAVKRYGGTTFVVVGRTHDPSIMDNIIKPKKKDPYERSPGYIGYLWKNKDSKNRAPHEVIPLDFTPIHVPYPTDWKNMFATKGFMLALHVPSFLAKEKNKLTRALYRVGTRSNIDVKNEWFFLEDLRNALASSQTEYHPTKKPEEQEKEYKTREQFQKIYSHSSDKGPIYIAKTRLAKGQISRQEYEELRKALEQ